jgi:hypothetical protein
MKHFRELPRDPSKRGTRLCFIALGLVVAVSGCGSGVASDQAIDLVGQPFPALTVTSESSQPLAPGTSPCDTIRALSISEVADTYKPIIDSVTLTCEVGKGIEDEPDVTTAVARVKPNTATFDGSPIIEIRMMDSAWGNDYQYVLAVPFTASEKQIAASTRKHCLLVAGRSSDDAKSCPVTQDSTHQGIYIDTGEGGGLWGHPDPANGEQTIFASAWSE